MSVKTCTSSCEKGKKSRHGVWFFAITASVIGILTLPCVATAALDDKEPVRVTMGGGSPGGTWALIGELIAETVRRSYPGSSLVYEPFGQAGAFAQMVAGEKFPITLAMSPFEIERALSGGEPFMKKYAPDDFYVVATLVKGQDSLLFARKKFTDRYGVVTLDDIARNHVPMRTSYTAKTNVFANTIMDGIYTPYGITPEKVEAWGGKIYQVGRGELFRLMQDERIDLFLYPTFHPDAGIIELSNAMELVAIPMGKEVVDEFAKKWHLETTHIPAAAYGFLREDYYTFSVPSFALAGPLATEEMVYKIVKGLYENFDYYRNAHPSFKAFSREMLAEHGPYRLHPGAERFYREVGLIK